MSARAGRVVAGALVAACLGMPLSACSGGGSQGAAGSSVAAPAMTYYPSPSTTAPTASATTATASSSAMAVPAVVEKPILPDEAKAHTPDGAAAFARYYMDLLAYAYMKPDPAPLQALSRATCGSCARYVQFSTELVKSGTHADAAPYVLEKAAPSAALESGEQLVIIVGRDGAYRLVGSGYTDDAPAPAGKSTPAQMYLVFEGGHWSVAALEKTS